MQNYRDQIRRRHGDDSGFTLIELLVVIVIIGILSAVVIFSVVGIKDRGVSSACKADKSTLKVAEEAAYANNGTYASEALLAMQTTVTSVGGASGLDLLESESDLYNITLVGTSPNFTDYSIVAVAGKGCT